MSFFMSAQISHIEAGLERLSKRMPDLPATEVLLSRLLVFLGRDLSAMLDQRIRPYGLNEVEFRTLMALFSYGQEPVYPSDLCSGVAQSPANITRITDALVDRGLISRVPSDLDRRRLVLRVTDKGEALVRELIPTMWLSVREVFEDFSAAEKQLLTELLKRLSSKLSSPIKAEDISL